MITVFGGYGVFGSHVAGRKDSNYGSADEFVSVLTRLVSRLTKPASRLTNR